MSTSWKLLAAVALWFTVIARCEAAPPEPIVPEQAIAKIATYKFGESRADLSVVEALVRRAAKTPNGAQKLAAMLHPLLSQQQATPDCKLFVCRQLAVLGSKESVPPLAILLGDPKTADMARYALEVIDDPSAGQALLTALQKSDGKTAIGLINSLGDRAETAATAALIERSQTGETEIRASAIHALGQIGGEESARALLRLKGSDTSKLGVNVSQACLACGDRFAAQGKSSAAKVIYTSMMAPGEPMLVRVAAFKGLVAVDDAQGLALVQQQLGAQEPELQDAALNLVRQFPGATATQAFVQQLSKLSPPRQALLIRALADRGDRSVLPAVTSALDDEDEGVRTAALYALGQVGGADSVKRLARVASGKAGPEQAAARQSLTVLRGDDVDAKIVSMLEIPTVKTRAQLAASLGPRNSVGAVKTLLQTSRDADPAVALASVTSLGSLASESDLPALVDLLLQAPEGAAREAAEKSLVTTARRIREPDRRTTTLLSTMADAKAAAAKARLLLVVGQIGGARAVAAVEQALKDENAEVREAAVRALSAWTATEALPVLLKVAKTNDVPAQRLLALQGYIRLLSMATENPRQTLAAYQEAFGLATRIEEKRQILMGLPRVRVPETLTFILPLLTDPDLAEDAARSAVQVSTVGRRSEISRDEARAAMQKVLAVTKNPATREAATNVVESK